MHQASAHGLPKIRRSTMHLHSSGRAADIIGDRCVAQRQVQRVAVCSGCKCRRSDSTSRLLGRKYLVKYRNSWLSDGQASGARRRCGTSPIRLPTLPYSSHEKSTHVAEEARGACDDNEESLQSSLILGVLRRVG